MTARRLLVILWIVLSAAVWNGMFDLLVTRGVKEYLYRQSEHARGRGPAVTMDVVMDRTVRDAAVTSSAWALLIGTAGLYTTLARSR